MSKKLNQFIFCCILFLQTFTTQAQKLIPGFDAAEYLDLLAVCEKTHTDSIVPGIKEGSKLRYELIYRSAEMGLKNRWEYWIREDGIGVISIRGTVQHPTSWMANFYAAQVAASGSLQINDSTVFNYKLANDDRAAVHVGWTIGLAHLGPDIKRVITQMYQEKKTTQFIVMGHSQGAALAFLVTSYLHYLREAKELPADLNFKSYCSAAPKPGNMYYAYDFDFISRGGKAFTIVNTADWVPESGFTVQTLDDFNIGNPFSNIAALLGSQKTVVRWYLKSMFHKMDKSTKKAQGRLDKYLGYKIYSQVTKILPQLREPKYAGTSNYMRAGIPIVLQPDDAYRAKFPDDEKKTFLHHLFEPYKMMINKYYVDAN